MFKAVPNSYFLKVFALAVVVQKNGDGFLSQPKLAFSSNFFLRLTFHSFHIFINTVKMQNLLNMFFINFTKN
jgi:hypothetical protein